MNLLRSTVLTIPAVVALLAQDAFLEVTARLPRGVAREDCRLILYVDGAKQGTPCSLRGSQGDAAFYCPLTPNARNARFKFELPSYKPYTRNAPIVMIGNASSRYAQINLGDLQPEPSEEPAIENIVLTSSADDAIRFQIALNNRSKKEVLITRIELSGAAESNCGIGTKPPVYFQLSKQLLLAPAKSGTIAIGGTLAANGDHPQFPYTVTGTGVFDRFGHSEFRLSAPATFDIPTGYSEIDLVIPASGSHPDWTRVVNSSRKNPVEAPATEMLAAFERIRFTLTTSNRDYAEIKSYYERDQ